MSGESQQELQQASQQLQVIQAQLQELNRERDALRETKRELQEARNALERLESGASVKVPLGGSAYVKAKIQDIDEVIVDIGGGFSAERPRDGAIDTLEEREEIVESRIESIIEQISELESAGAEIEQEVQQLAQREQLGGADGPA